MSAFKHMSLLICPRKSVRGSYMYVLSSYTTAGSSIEAKIIDADTSAGRSRKLLKLLARIHEDASDICTNVWNKGR